MEGQDAESAEISAGWETRLDGPAAGVEVISDMPTWTLQPVAFPPLNVLRLYIQMRYEWDEEKNRLNQKKHRISFEMAALAFEDECCLVRPDRVDETGEQRWYAIGAARLGLDASVVLFVVHVYREEIDGKEITRIISARRADKDDFRRYQEQKMD